MKLKSKITFSVITILFIATGLLGYIYLQASTASIQNEVSENFQLLSKSYATQIDLKLNSYKKSIRDLSSAIITSIYAGDALKEAARLYPEFSQIFYTDKQGKVIDLYPYNSIDMQLDFSKMEFWRSTLASNETQITANIDFGYPALILTSPVVLPFLSRDMPLTHGIAVITIPLDTFFKEYQDIEIGKSGFIFIIDSNDRIILHKDTELILKKKLTEISNEVSLDEVAESMNSFSSGHGFYELNGDRYYISFYPIFNTGWSLAVTGLIDEYHTESRNLSIFLLGIFIIIVIPTIFIIFNIVNRIVMPLRNIREILKQMAKGEISSYNLLEQDGQDELSEISNDFKKIIGNLEHIARELNIDLEKEKKALHETILRFHAIFNQSSQNIWIMDLEGKILEANDSFYKKMNLKRKEIQNIHFWDQPFISKRKKRSDEIRDSILNAKDKVSSRMELNIRDPENKIFVLDMTVKPVVDDHNNVVLIVCEGRDITDRKKVELELEIYRSHLEELVESRTNELKEAQKELLIKEKFAALGKLTAIVSHEIRNPLATIRSSAYLIKEKTKNDIPKLRNTIERLERNVSRCDQIIEELLDYSRTPTLSFKPVSIDEWLPEILNTFEFDESVSIKQTLNCGKFVSIDTENFRRVIVNLLTNAIQALTEDSSIDNDEIKKEIEINTLFADHTVKIIISDNGPGIPEENISKIFEPLFSTKSFGVGLGLPIVEQIVKQHSGTISVKSKEGSGAEFIVVLPVAENEEKPDKA